MEIDAHEASDVAAHKAKSAQMAIEVARELQLQEAVNKTAIATKDALLEGLKEVFSNSDSENPQHMTVLIRRIPILCVNITAMHDDIADIKDNQKWAMRAIVGMFITIIIAVIVNLILK